MILRGIDAPASDPPVIRKRADVPRNAEENAKIGWPRLKERGLPFRLFACSELGHGIVGAMPGQPRNFKNGNGPFSPPSFPPSLFTMAAFHRRGID